uniref:Alpha/beta hydrolase fold domain-containing protein n=1 Tax=Phenylobacterium glaciei TaxID=2803784 RepID=A0A974P4A4_9CAUL|nr:alpha/beta hydrolase fold domain-containing protein [Phenylobacterium glaciei]
MLAWFFKHTLTSSDQASDSRLNLVSAKLDGLPPTTIILAEIDPLHDDGAHLADRLKAAGVTVDVKEYAGVTHEFFGMGSVVADAKAAETYAADKLKAAFGLSPHDLTSPAGDRRRRPGARGNRPRTGARPRFRRRRR